MLRTTLALFVLLLIAAPSPARGQSAKARAQALLPQLVARMEARARAFEGLGRAFPHEAAWGDLALATRDAAARVKGATVRFGDLSAWWSSAAAGGKPVAAWKSGELWLDVGAFDVGLPFRPTARERADFDRKQVDLESYLVHESVHMTQGVTTRLGVLDPGETEAWTAQYRYLAACGMDATSPAMDNTLQQLVRFGVLASARDTKALDARLGVDVLRARQATPTASAPAPANDPAARGRRLCAAYAEMTRREVAKRNQEAPGQYQLKVLAPFEYVKTADGEFCSCAFEVLKKVDGTSTFSGVFQRGAAGKPDLVPLSLVETWLKRAVTDPFFAGIVW